MKTIPFGNANNYIGTPDFQITIPGEKTTAEKLTARKKFLRKELERVNKIIKGECLPECWRFVERYRKELADELNKYEAKRRNARFRLEKVRAEIVEGILYDHFAIRFDYPRLLAVRKR